MLIIVEGVDGVGKTSFAQTLEKRIRDFAPHDEVHILHKGPPQLTPLEEYELDLQDYWPGDGRHFICDRWHLGNLVYGPLFRGEGTDPAENYHIEKFLMSRGALVVTLVAPVSTILKRRAERGEDDMLADEQVTAVQNAFFDVSWESRIGARVMKLEDGLNQENVLTILRDARAAEIEATPLSGFRSYVGHCHPQILLLGEQKNTRRDDRWYGAFVPVGGSAGRYLIQALTPEVASMAGFANALEENVEALYSVLGQPAVVALGTRAKKVCMEQGVPHGSVPHPQYVRRFHHHHAEEYGQAIRHAAMLGEELISWRP